MNGVLLFYIGIGIVTASTVFGIAFVLLTKKQEKELRDELTREYGEKRH